MTAFIENIHRHLPALIVVIPLIAGMLCVFLRGGQRAWLLATGTSWTVFAMAVRLLQQVDAEPSGMVTYMMGGWAPPYGIEYRIDFLNGFVLLVVAMIAGVVTFYARASVAQEIPAEKTHFFYAVWMLCLTGMLGITITGDAFNVYVLLEISSLTAYTLVALGKYRDRRALTASINYLVLGTVGASFILLGIGYLYMVTGTLNMADMATRLSDIYAQWDAGNFVYRKTIITALVFLAVGFSIKIALFPLHGWLPNAYTYAPSAVSAFLASTATKVGVYIAIRFLYTVVGKDFSLIEMPTQFFLIIFASMAVLICSYIAIMQTNVKKLLAYSSIAQIGYMALGFSLLNEQALTGSIVHLFNHALTKGGLFLALGCVAYQVGGTDLKHLRGLGRKMPYTMAAITAGGLGLVGVPLTAGFVSKWYLITGALEMEMVGVAIVILVGSMLAFMYVWRVVEVIYFQPCDESAADVKEAPWHLVGPTWVLIGASLYFGIHSGAVTEIAARAAHELLR